VGESWIVETIDRAGYVGIALLMLAENIFPPIPSEVIMPVAGVAAASGTLSLPGVIAAGSAGALAGQLLWFYAGVWLGVSRLMRLAERHGRWMTVAPADIEHACGWLRARCATAVLVGRVVPAIRTLISLPAGIARLPLAVFVLFSSIGTAAWSGLLAWAGFRLGERHADIGALLDPISTAVFAAIAAWYAWRVATFRTPPNVTPDR
jgi:membrane protein DedA with SNARE-associated domain